MDQSKIKWIFFDMGHTLLDEDGVHIARLEELTEELAEMGKTCPPVESPGGYTVRWDRPSRRFNSGLLLQALTREAESRYLFPYVAALTARYRRPLPRRLYGALM